MFFATAILEKKSSLGRIWLAAHQQGELKKMKKSGILETNIEESIPEIMNPEFALRLTSHLLVGICRIHDRKVYHLFHDCQAALNRIQIAYRPDAVDQPAEETGRRAASAITLPPIAESDLMFISDEIATSVDPNSLVFESFVPSAAPQAKAFKHGIILEDEDEDALLDSVVITKARPSVESEIARQRDEEDGGFRPDYEEEEYVPQMFNEGEEEKLPYRMSTDSGMPGMDIMEEEEAPLGLDMSSIIAKQPKKRKRIDVTDAVTVIAEKDLKAMISSTSQSLLKEVTHVPNTKRALLRRELDRSGLFHVTQQPLLFDIAPQLTQFLNTCRGHLDHQFAAEIGREVAEEEMPMAPPVRDDDEEDRNIPLPEEEEYVAPVYEEEEYQPQRFDEEKEDEVETGVSFSQVAHAQAFVADGEGAAHPETERTRKMRQMLTVSFEESGKSKLNFNQLMKGQKRSIAATCFFELLVLTGRGEISVNQNKPYGPIDIEMTA